ncbi:MAG TPA: glycosyltransferase family 2 protein [Chryseolinea sp.]
MIKISAVVITYNEEHSIGLCIKTLKSVADEIVVVDSFSKDNTKAICLQEGVKFVEHVFEGHIQQKNFALTMASHEYVLSLDADEYLSDELILSIRAIKENVTHQAYSMNRLTGIGGRWIYSTDWYPDRKLRLWAKSIGKWGGYNPHDTVILNNGVSVAHLKGDLMHDGYEDYDDLMSKANQYARIFAKANQNKKSSSVFKVIYKSAYTFIRNYFLKLGFTSGFDGLVISCANTYYTFFKYAMLRELNKQKGRKKR